jgi:hypothetical protein
MPGLLADVNVQGHLTYLRRFMEGLGILELLMEMGLTLETFRDCGLDRRINDRELWNYCQAHGWMLFTDNRNHEDENSLNATIQDSWQPGHLAVLTLANKGRFENSESYATRVAKDVAEQLTLAFLDGVREQTRIFVPL